MTLFEKLASKFPGKYRIREILHVPYLIENETERVFAMISIDDLISIADTLGVKIWSDLSWDSDPDKKQWGAKYWAKWMAHPSHSCEQCGWFNTQQAAYLAALEAAVDAMEGESK